jgi:hypothetical protein
MPLAAILHHKYFDDINPFIVTLKFNVFGSQIMFWLAKQLPPTSW